MNHSRKRKTVLHFVGIGGIGMSGIAEVFLNQGYRVTGSDVVETETTRRLTQLGVRIFSEHSAGNVSEADVVVVSSAIGKKNPEILEAKRLRIPVIPRAEMLGELMRGKVGIAVAGSHGKTTTTSMLATVFTTAELDPTLVVGGKVDSLGGNAKLGQGHFVIAEADESDGSFLHLPATYGVVTNIDNDHLDHFQDLSAIEDAFVDFVGKLPFYGLAVVCGEDPGVKRCLERWTKPFLTYGFSEDCDLSVRDIELKGLGSEFSVLAKNSDTNKSECLGRVRIHVPGKHNILNALATIGIARRLEIPFEVIAKGLEEFKGVKRRFEIRWFDETSQRVIVDDYGHHPTEIQATLAAARQYWSGRIISIFQPHRYTRTLHCGEGFASAFHMSDVIFVTDIYGAGEEPIPGVNSESLVEKMKTVAKHGQQIFYTGDLALTRQILEEHFMDGDLVLCLGAGSITKLADDLAATRVKPVALTCQT